MRFVFSVFCLVSRQYHNISTIHQLAPTLSLPRYYPASLVIWVDPTTYAPSSGLVSSASRTHIAAGKHRSSQVPVKSLGQHAMDYDPGGVSAISPISMASLLSSVFLNHVDSLHSISIFGAEYLHPCGLRPTASLFTLHPHDYPYRCKTRDGRLTLSGWLLNQLNLTSLAWRTKELLFCLGKINIAIRKIATFFSNGCSPPLILLSY